MAETPIILAKNIWLNASAAADYGHDDFPAYRISDGHRGSKWESTQDGTQKVDFVVPDEDVIQVEAFVLDRGFVLTGATVVVKGAANAAFTQSVVTVATLNDPDPEQIHLVIFETPTTKKYWRIEINGVTVTPIIFNAGIFPVIDLGMNPVSPFDPQRKIIVIEKFESGGGADQLHVRREKREVRADYPRMSDALYGKIIQAFDDAGDNPIWWFFRPESDEHDGVYGFIESERDFPIVNNFRDGEVRIVEA